MLIAFTEDTKLGETCQVTNSGIRKKVVIVILSGIYIKETIAQVQKDCLS